MKEKVKNISIIILLVGLIVCITAYIKKEIDYSNLKKEVIQLSIEEQAVNNADKEPKVESTPISKSIIRATTFDEEKLNGYNLLSEVQIDIDDDTTSEFVYLYSDVDEKNGEYIWDDGQRWLLLVREEKKEYVLFDDYIQLGQIEAYVYEDLTEEKFHITTVLKASAGMSIKDFVFDKNGASFYEEDVFNISNINNLRFVRANNNLMD